MIQLFSFPSFFSSFYFFKTPLTGMQAKSSSPYGCNGIKILKWKKTFQKATEKQEMMRITNLKVKYSNMTHWKRYMKRIKIGVTLKLFQLLTFFTILGLETKPICFLKSIITYLPLNLKTYYFINRLILLLIKFSWTKFTMLHITLDVSRIPWIL